MDIWRDRRPSARRDGDDGQPFGRAGLADANARLRQSAPRYRQDQVRRQIRTTAVRRYRARQSGRGDFSTIGEYVDHMTGAGNG